MRPIVLTIVGAFLALTFNLSLPLFPGVKRTLGVAPYMPWHGNEAWDRLLIAIDKNNQDKIAECKSKHIDTGFGQTQVYACGNEHHTPIMLHHAALATSNMWGQWMVPKLLSQDYYVLLVDFLCTNGHSIPKGGDPRNCPSSEEEMAAWVAQVATGLDLKTPVSMMGASYGASIAFMTALHKPDLVDRLVLLAPGGIFFDISPLWLWRWLVHSAFPSSATHAWFYSMMNHNKTNHEVLDSLELEQELAKLEAMVPIYAVPMKPYPEETLRKVLKHHHTFLGIGDRDSLVLGGNGSAVVEHAKDTGVAKAVLYPEANHFICMDSPTKKDVAGDVLRFLHDEAGTIQSDVVTFWE